LGLLIKNLKANESSDFYRKQKLIRPTALSIPGRRNFAAAGSRSHLKVKRLRFKGLIA